MKIHSFELDDCPHCREHHYDMSLDEIQNGGVRTGDGLVITHVGKCGYGSGKPILLSVAVTVLPVTTPPEKPQPAEDNEADQPEPSSEV